MSDFVRVATASPNLRVADPYYNVKEMLKWKDEAEKQSVSLLLYPELCVSGYTAQDLLLQEGLQKACLDALRIFSEETEESSLLFVVGFPFLYRGKLYNAALVMQEGRILGIVPKKHLPNHSEFYEERYFQEGREEVEWIMDFLSKDYDAIPFGMNLHFTAEQEERFRLAVEICEDLWVPNPPSITHAMMGATVIANPTASDTLIGKGESRRALLKQNSASLHTAYIYASAGPSESTGDMVFSAHSMIVENGKILSESPYFHEGLTISDIDLSVLWQERVKQNSFETVPDTAVQIPVKLRKMDFTAQGISLSSLEMRKEEEQGNKEEREKGIAFSRYIHPLPFLPLTDREDSERGTEILCIQAEGLKKRLEHTGLRKVILGLSGGLDSTLALFVAVKCFQLLSYDVEDIYAVTMPSFGTSKRTHNNALDVAKILGVRVQEISIEKAVRQHFQDIGQDEKVKDLVYENAQARERTQILMDLANKEKALLLGTGDLSESALGFSTYNGDHMSMYSVNCDVPKTAIPLVLRSFVEKYRETASQRERDSEKNLENIVEDIIHAPVSPELLPPDEKGEIAQKTEELLGPYVLHDFFLYMHLRYGFSPEKLFFLACHAFSEENLAFCRRKDVPEPSSPKLLLQTLKVFYKRFFSQQFKRSCVPDGPKVGRIALSPRGDLRMPSDASSYLWLHALEEIEKSI